jgi:ATP-dependent Lhr-like helicase
MPLSSELASVVAEKMRQASGGGELGAEMAAVRPILQLQQAWSLLPEMGKLVIEETETRSGHHLFVFPLAGRLVHEGLASLVASRLARDEPRSLEMSFNDYGFELHSPEHFRIDGKRWRELLSTENLLEDLVECLNMAELAKRQFREVARVAGLVISSFPGRRKSTRSLQASSGLLYDVFAKYDPENLLLKQAEREILQRQLELSRLRQTLEQLESWELVQVVTRRLTPLAFPLWADRLGAESLSSESFSKRIERMLEELEAEVHREGGGLAQGPEIIESSA